MTPAQATLLVRVAIAAGGALLAVLMLGPFQGLENAVPVSDKVLHAGAFYVLANGLFIALPRNRRNDIALGLLAIAGASEVLQGLVGRDCDIFDVMADAAGIYGAVIPMWAERLRQLTRETPYGDLAGLWNANNRRQRSAAPSRPMAMPKGTKPWSHATAPVRRAAPAFNPDGPSA
jgi:VanZ family protein